MKFDRQSIRRLVLEEVSAMNRPRRKTLTSLLFEDAAAADAIKKAAKAGPAAVVALANSYGDKEELKNTLQGSFDKEETDDTVDITSAVPKKVSDFIPTQKDIDLMKSVAFPLGGFESLESMISSNTTTAPGAISVSGNEVLDGHHRWSGVWGICGPDGTINVQDMGFTGDTSDKLAQAQLAIAAYKPADLPQPSAAEPIPFNIMKKSKEQIKGMILDNVGEQTDSNAPGPLLNDDVIARSSQSPIVANWAGFKVGADKEEVIDKIADKVASNLSTLPFNDNAPERINMPQFDDKSMGDKKTVKAAIYKGLETGAFNVKKPFEPDDVKSQKESRLREDNVVMERWQRLAGLIK